MKKAKTFKEGDKVFAKVKGYPAWPAEVIKVNGKKYNVKFYGTGETGTVRVEDICYYSRQKKQTLKRKDYNDAVEEIEEAIRQSGGDVENGPDNEVDSPNIPVVTKKVGKRKRTLSNSSEKIAKKAAENTNSEDTINNDEPEFRSSNEAVIANKEDKTDTTELVEDEESFSIVSEQYLKNNIAYANHVRNKEAEYKSKSAEDRPDKKLDVLALRLGDKMVGVKLHDTWPLPRFNNELDRALFDETEAKLVLERKELISSQSDCSESYFVPDLKLTEAEVADIIKKQITSNKKRIIDTLKIESRLVELDTNIKNCLGLEKASPEEAVEYLNAMMEIEVTELMLKKHPHVFDTMRRLRKYVGNIEHWNLSETELKNFEIMAEKVRAKADQVYQLFMNTVQVPEESIHFWEAYIKVVEDFKESCKELQEGQVFVLCAEPGSRQAFLDLLDDERAKSDEAEDKMEEGEKENSSGVANLENAEEDRNEQ